MKHQITYNNRNTKHGKIKPVLEKGILNGDKAWFHRKCDEKPENPKAYDWPFSDIPYPDNNNP